MILTNTERMVRKDWLLIPKNVDISLFLTGDCFINPDSIKELQRALIEFQLNKKEKTDDRFKKHTIIAEKNDSTRPQEKND